MKWRINIRLFIVLHYQGSQHFLHRLIFIVCVSVFGEGVWNHCKVMHLRQTLAVQFLTSARFLNIWMYAKTTNICLLGTTGRLWRYVKSLYLVSFSIAYIILSYHHLWNLCVISWECPICEKVMVSLCFLVFSRYYSLKGTTIVECCWQCKKISE